MRNEDCCLAFQDFSFFYAGKAVLQHLAFTVSPGQWLNIIGPNGSGKSTLLKCALLLNAGGKSVGRIAAYGRPVASYSRRQLARIMAYVPQMAQRIPPFSVRDFIGLSRYALERQGTPRSFNDAVEAALELTGTAQLADRRMDQLSGGQRQLVFLAAALAQQCPLLLLDEPAAFLDPCQAGKMNDILRKIHARQDMAIINVTHDLNQAIQTGGQVLALKNGRQIFYGPVARLTEGEGILEKVFEHQFSYLSHPRTHEPLVVA